MKIKFNKETIVSLDDNENMSKRKKAEKIPEQQESPISEEEQEKSTL